MPEKKYLSSTGVDEFYYGLLNTGETGIVAAAPERVKFLQDIEVAMSSEITRAYGDNIVAELGVSQGGVAVSGNFHTIPQSDKNALLGLEVTAGGLCLLTDPVIILLTLQLFLPKHMKMDQKNM